ncbi:MULTISPECIES: hypothetical protein [unclassified Streptomyces]|uniref:hypothetical protein n=1 Tax=unclassified Streptomyces TaxID=2593676 RepID=UPI0034108496
MRPLYVPVRLAATVVAVAAVAGCMSVGDDGGGEKAKPSHSAGQRGGEAPDGGPAARGGGSGFGPHADVDGKRGKKKGKGKGKKAGGSAEPSDSPSAGASASRPAGGGPEQPGRTDGPGPTRPADPEPTRPAEPEPTPTQEPSTPTPTPPTAEPSSSAHEETAPQLGRREPAPAAQAPV